MIKYNTKEKQSQVETLQDKSASGRIRPWAIYKIANTYLAMAYETVNERRSERMRNCASELHYHRIGDKMRLVHADFCRVRLCPICQWRRSLKNFGHMNKIVSAIGDKCRYIFLTLTIKSCNGPELSEEMTHMIKAFKAFIEYKACEQAFKGWYRGLEVTHNLDTDEYHPHLHVLLAVNPSYFHSKHYLSQKQITDLWQRALKVHYTPIVDIRKCYGNDVKSIAEVAKYACKPGDIINYDDWDLTVDTVRVLDAAFEGRRLIAYGGLLKEWHKKLNLDDADDGDLLDIGEAQNDIEARDDEGEDLTFVWHTGYNQYVRNG